MASQTHCDRSALPIGSRVCKRGIDPYNALSNVARRDRLCSFQELDERSPAKEEQKEREALTSAKAAGTGGDSATLRRPYFSLSIISMALEKDTCFFKLLPIVSRHESLALVRSLKTLDRRSGLAPSLWQLSKVPMPLVVSEAGMGVLVLGSGQGRLCRMPLSSLLSQDGG